MSRTTAFILTAGLAVGVLAFAGSTNAQRVDPGEEIVLKRCQDCHTVRVIHTSAKTAEAWQKTIQGEIDNRGLQLPAEEIPVLVRYLTLNHGPVPEGPGKEILLNTCTMCHDLGRIKTGRRSAEEWEETLNSMLNEGAPLSEEQFPVIHHYLSRHFGFE